MHPLNGDMVFLLWVLAGVYEKAHQTTKVHGADATSQHESSQLIYLEQYTQMNLHQRKSRH